VFCLRIEEAATRNWAVKPYNNNNNNNNNVKQKEAEKKQKYKSLRIEIQGMWNMKCMITSVIIGATGIVTKV
jgi:hypothetical protein